MLSSLARSLIGLGALILAFVAYQLWGTGLSESHSQNALRHQLAGHLGHQAPSSTVPATAPPNPPPAEGTAVGIISIAKIGVDKAVVEGTGTSDLRHGPGHYAGTPLPGQPGNVAIAGHRTTYGAPFYNLNELGYGDPILVTTPQGTFHYNVTRSFVVAPSEVSVIAPSPASELTLTTCNPRFSASQRLIVQASLVGIPAPAPVISGRQRPAPTSLADNSGSWLPVLAWGLTAVAGGAVIWLIARLRRRRWPIYLLGAPAFLALLFEFFAAISKLLPASV